MSGDFARFLGILFLVALAVDIYFIPTMVALFRKHHNALAIFGCNLIFGWTLLGWGVALVWALMQTRKSA